jgi:very-short-patch-repair endonuclease
MDLERRIAELASNQHGLLTRPQLRELGVSASAVDRRLRTGRLESLYPEVYVVGGSAKNSLQELLGAVLSMGRGSAISHFSAAGVWGMLSPPGQVHVATPRPRWREKPFVVHRSTDLGPRYIGESDGIPVTTPARTVVDLGAVAGRRTVGLALDAALRDGLTTLADVEDVINRVARKGRAGVGHARVVIEQRRLWHTETESVLEDLFRQLVHDAGLPDPQPQVQIRDVIGRVVARVDFAYPEHRLAIELDGFRFHSDRESFVRDRARQNAVLSTGYRLLRYTARDLRQSPVRVVAEVSRFLAQPGLAVY